MRKDSFERPSEQLLRAIDFLQGAKDWVTSKQIATAASCSESSAREYVRRLVAEEMMIVQKRYPAYLYKLNPDWAKTPLGQYICSMM